MLYILAAILATTAVAAAAPQQQPVVDAVGSDTEEEGDIAGRLDRNAPTLYDKNQRELQRQHQRQHPCCPPENTPRPRRSTNSRNSSAQ